MTHKTTRRFVTAECKYPEDIKQAHTPGPWLVIGTDIKADNGAHTVAIVGVSAIYNNADEIEANARLIAAAPKMLSGLYDALHMMESDNSGRLYGTVPDDIRAIIAEATGEVRS